MKIILSLFIFFWALQLSAQTDFRFADSTAQWNVQHTVHSFLTPVYTETEIYTYCRDTVIESTSYQKICRSGYNLAAYDPQFIRKDSLEHVYVRSYLENEIKIYDFRKSINDTVYHSDLLLGIVDSADSVYLGKWRKRMFIGYTYFWGSGEGTKITFPFIWIDGIGATQENFLYPSITVTCEGCDSYSLLCYFENDQRLYHSNFFADSICNYYENYLDVKEIGSSKIDISPNPVSMNGAITVQLTETLPGETIFQLFDLTGRIILQKPLTEKLSRVELPNISKGMYLYNVVSDDGKMHLGKLVVE